MQCNVAEQIYIYNKGLVSDFEIEYLEFLAVDAVAQRVEQI